MVVFAMCVSGSSPLTRGALDVGAEDVVVAGLIPAYAGSTVALLLARGTRTAHPRLRGEHPGFEDVLGDFEGSSPLTRGAHLLSRDDKSLKAILHTVSSRRAKARLIKYANFLLSVGCTFCGLGVLSTNPSDASFVLVYVGASLT